MKLILNVTFQNHPFAPPPQRPKQSLFCAQPTTGHTAQSNRKKKNKGQLDGHLTALY